MKYIFLSFICLFIPAQTFAQKDEKLRYLLSDTEQTDSAYLRTIIQRIYFSAFEGKIKSYFYAHLNYLEAEFKSKNEFCEIVLVQSRIIDYEEYDSAICTKVNIDSIKTFSIYFDGKSSIPKSISIEFSGNISDENIYPSLWVSFTDLYQILNPKEINELMESTKYLPLIEDY